MTEPAGHVSEREATRARAAAGAARGVVASLHCKPETAEEHGLPKPSVTEVTIVRSGLTGDFNRYRHEVSHDDEKMAVLLIPRETLADLRREGWPVAPGDLGENISSSGVPYGALSPGVRFRVGPAELEVTKPCTPCDNLYLLPYVGADRGPAFLKTMIDRRGWYARVLREGTVRVGDPIEILPSG